MTERRPDYVILSGGGSITPPGTVSPEAEDALIRWLDEHETKTSSKDKP